jgi:hypothetical protein
MARFPTLGYAATRSIVQRLLEQTPVDFTEQVVYVGDDTEPVLDLGSLQRLGDELPTTIEQFEGETEIAADRDALEGRLAVELYATLDPAHISLEVLDDPAFWRYVGVRHLWPFVHWREPAIEPGGDWVKIAPYVDGLRASECVALRMFVRASIATEAGAIELSRAVPRATDFWRSHLVRVGTGAVPPLARAFVEKQAQDRLPADDVRVTARKINRTRTNVVMHRYDNGEADEFVKSVW